MSLRVMMFVGFVVLVLGCLASWLTPMTTSQPRSITPIGTSAVSHGGIASADHAKSRVDHPGSLGYARKWIYRGGKR
ncbi:MAG: hypothetical protein A2V62_06705 [Nitrospirae bacterium RBG_19FT_COMBO_58_9]|nr:MAG: hypothetical protein A2V62_06705 [Nitrospirae bacterium RBG_19FT_COMBO_58_9]